MSAPETEPDVFGKRMFAGMILFVGLCILAFGLVQMFSGQVLTGSIIVCIALGDFAIMGLLYRKL